MLITWEVSLGVIDEVSGEGVSDVVEDNMWLGGGKVGRLNEGEVRKGLNEEGCEGSVEDVGKCPWLIYTLE